MVSLALVLLALLTSLALVAHVLTRLLAARAERRHPRVGRMIEVGPDRVHVVERGSGRPIVFLHGAFGSLADLDLLARSFADTHRTVLLDRPGHGYSSRPADDPRTPEAQAEWLARVLGVLGIERAVLVGFSFGGAVALAHALRRPDDVAAVVLLNGAVRDWEGPTSPLFTLPDLPLVGRAFLWTVATPFAHLTSAASVRHAFAPEAVAPAFMRSPIALGLRPGALRASCAEMRVLRRALARQQQSYGELHVPVVVVAGTGDQVASHERHSIAAALVLPRAELVLLEGAGHQIPYSRPADAIRAVERALALSQPATSRTTDA